MRHVGTLLLLLALAGCAAPPDPPATPTATRTASAPPSIAATFATPTATITPRRPTLIVESGTLAMPAWSPDGEWISFLSQRRPPTRKGLILTPGFYHVETGELCHHDDLSGVYFPALSPTSVGWQADGAAIIAADGRAFVGEPCGEFVREEPSGEGEETASPDGRTVEETRFDPQTGEGITTIREAATGETLHEIVWRRRMQGGDIVQWVGGDALLVTVEDERGPLLVEVGGDVIEVLPELFGIDNPPFAAYRATGAVNAEGDLHLLLKALPDLSVRLYHAESGEVERLPFGDHYGFSPDGEWAILAMPDEGPVDDAAKWARGVDGDPGEAFVLARTPQLVWSGPTGLVAFNEVVGGRRSAGAAVIMGFPEGQVIQYWSGTGHTMDLVGWSPDGTGLLVWGSSIAVSDPEDGGSMALYLVEVRQ